MNAWFAQNEALRPYRSCAVKNVLFALSPKAFLRHDLLAERVETAGE